MQYSPNDLQGDPLRNYLSWLEIRLRWSPNMTNQHDKEFLGLGKYIIGEEKKQAEVGIKIEHIWDNHLSECLITQPTISLAVALFREFIYNNWVKSNSFGPISRKYNIPDTYMCKYCSNVIVTIFFSPNFFTNFHKKKLCWRKEINKTFFNWRRKKQKSKYLVDISLILPQGYIGPLGSPPIDIIEIT